MCAFSSEVFTFLDGAKACMVWGALGLAWPTALKEAPWASTGVLLDVLCNLGEVSLWSHIYMHVRFSDTVCSLAVLNLSM